MNLEMIYACKHYSEGIRDITKNYIRSNIRKREIVLIHKLSNLGKSGYVFYINLIPVVHTIFDAEHGNFGL